MFGRPLSANNPRNNHSDVDTELTLTNTNATNPRPVYPHIISSVGSTFFARRPTRYDAVRPPNAAIPRISPTVASSPRNTSMTNAMNSTGNMANVQLAMVCTVRYPTRRGFFRGGHQPLGPLTGSLLDNTGAADGVTGRSGGRRIRQHPHLLG